MIIISKRKKKETYAIKVSWWEKRKRKGKKCVLISNRLYILKELEYLKEMGYLLLLILISSSLFKNYPR
jgi:hypothetical protein